MPSTLRDNLARSRHVRQLAETLRTLFRRQALDVASRVTLDGDVPELVGWVEPIAEAAKPILLRLTQQGIAETQVRLMRRGIMQPTGDGLRRHALPVGVAFGETAKGVMLHGSARQSPQCHVQVRSVQISTPRLQVTKAAASDVRIAFDLFNPRVIDAVDAAAFAFCRETMETARSDLATALSNLRRLMRAGLRRGDAMRKLAEDVHRIFADPYRAYRIAVTEASRAQHRGNFIADKEAGTTHKEWVASPDACELCLSLMELGPIPIDQPFRVDPKGGAYAVCMFPPCHPHDFCTYSSVAA